MSVCQPNRSEPLPSPMIIVGALTKLPGRGRVSGVGAVRACAFGLTTLQQGMGGLAERMHPPFSRVPHLALMRSVLTSLRMSTRTNLSANAGRADHRHRGTGCRSSALSADKAQVQSRRRPIGDILGLSSDRPSRLLRPPRCGIWCWVQIHLDNL
jgi:hypothetical protein